MTLSQTKRSLPEEYRRVVFIGDSITDGHTYPLLVQQALMEAAYERPTFINAGIGGDTARDMAARLERDVLAFCPTFATLSAGINDVLTGTSLEEYSRSVRSSIVERLRVEKIPVMVLTTSILGPTHTERQADLIRFNEFLRSVAAEYGCPLAEVYNEMQQAQRSGAQLLEDDDIHLNFAGYRCVARAVLDGFGFHDVAVPERLKTTPLPGIIPTWRIRAVSEVPPLDAKSLAELTIDESWKPYSLDRQQLTGMWWLDQEIARGFAVAVDREIGNAQSYQAAATFYSPEAKTMCLKIGANVRQVWLSTPGGAWQHVCDASGSRGWHAGKVRVPVALGPGENIIVIETGPSFFVSLTDDDSW
jgi:lysophospholipase L1-like esterase